MPIDLNADVGEGFGPWQMGEDEALIPLLTSVNVAAGFHAGDPSTILRTIELAALSAVAVGAHPGYPDLVGFGRRDLDMAPADIEAAVLYQVGAVAALARAVGVPLRHVKPHGALYSRSAHRRDVADAIASAVRRFDPTLTLVGLAGSTSIAAARAAGIAAAGEGFADRRYHADGRLLDRRHPDALVADADEAAYQALRIARDGEVEAIGGEVVRIEADTICLHGDAPGAAARARAVRAALTDAGIDLRPLGA